LPLPSALLSFALLGGCASASHTGAAPPPAAAAENPELAEFSDWMQALQHSWLDRGTVAEPVLSRTAQTRTEDGLTITVSPVLPEAQPWNAWPDGTSRLFNDAIGYLWQVKVVSTRPVRWSPEHTALAVNDTEQVFNPAPEPDDLLWQLVKGAALETRLGAPANLSLRVRQADDFRHAYLGTETATGAHEGVLLFPAPTRQIQAVAMELTLGIAFPDEGVKQYRFLFE
jgi:hypothetical protein